MNEIWNFLLIYDKFICNYFCEWCLSLSIMCNVNETAMYDYCHVK